MVNNLNGFPDARRTRVFELYTARDGVKLKNNFSLSLAGNGCLNFVFQGGV